MDNEEKIHLKTLRREHNAHQNKTIEKFLNLNSNKYLYEQGKIKIDVLKMAIQSLPEELKIQEKRKKLCKN